MNVSALGKDLVNIEVFGYVKLGVEVRARGIVRVCGGGGGREGEGRL